MGVGISINAFVFKLAENIASYIQAKALRSDSIFHTETQRHRDTEPQKSGTGKWHRELGQTPVESKIDF
jgi:hypothetical protein